MTGTVTDAEKARPGKYWIDKNGVAYKVTDHLMSARYAQMDSDEYDRPMHWGYADMWRNGWSRVDIERGAGGKLSIWADSGSRNPNHKQRAWINDARAYLAHEFGDIPVSTGKALAGVALSDSITPGRAAFLNSCRLCRCR